MSEMNQQPPALGKTCPLAVWSLALGVLGVIACVIAPLLAIPAVICGHVALARIGRSGGALKGNGMAIAGLVTGYIGIVLPVIAGILAAMLLPAVATARERARRVRCSSNEHQVLLATKMYAVDHQEAFPPDLGSLTGYVDNADLFICPSSGHAAGAMANVAEWSDYWYVAGLTEADPPQCVLLICPPENHRKEGANVTFVDGSVRWFSAEEFARLTNTPALFYGTKDEQQLAALQQRARIQRATQPITGRR
jgi:prepilin-type processing-associated H-X9-DG protein